MMRYVLRRAGALVFAAACAAAVHAQPVIRVTQEVARTTVSNRIRIDGIASGDSPIVNVYWVDTLGRRGAVNGTPAGPVFTWTASIPLQPGANRLTVIAVDALNRAATLPFYAMRNVPAAAAPTEIRAGRWRGMPVTYAVVN